MQMTIKYMIKRGPCLIKFKFSTPNGNKSSQDKLMVIGQHESLVFY